MNADSSPVLTGQALPFAVWIAAIDLLCLESWQVDAYAVGPQPWHSWHSDGWTPERVMMELSTPTTPPDIDDEVLFLDRPTVTVTSTFWRSKTMDHEQLSPAPDPQEIEIALRYLDMEQEALINVFATREQKTRALARLNIAVTPEQTPLDAWVLAMCRENGLPEQLPAIPIGEVANQLCPKWVFWLA